MERQNAIQASDLAIDFRTCIERAVTPPWRAVLVEIRESSDFSVRIEADSSDLQLRRRPGDYRQQRLVELALSRFLSYTVLDPERRQFLVDAGGIVPLSSVRARAAPELAPFEPFRSGNSTLLINEAGGEFCVLHDIPPDWPNPSVRCQLVRGEYTGGVTFSGEAVEQVPELLGRIRGLVDRLVPCFDLLDEPENG